MLKANNDHLLLANGTLQSNLQRIELNIVSLKAELSSVNTKIEVMIGESNYQKDLTTEQENQIAN